jgi:hypothetical protein
LHDTQDLRAQLEHAATQKLDAKLAEQRHDLLTAATREKAEGQSS